MFDASSKIPTSLLEGNVFDLGNYDECLKIEYEEKNEVKVAKYCGAAIIITIPRDKIPIDLNGLKVVELII